MARTTAAFGIAAAIALVSGGAFAAGGVSGKGETGGGKGGNGPGAAPAAGDASGAGDVVAPDAARTQNPDVTTRRVEQPKPWEVGVAFETHRMIRQDDLEGQGASKVFNTFGLYARYDLTEHDRIGVREFIDQRFIADQGETGFRTGDVSLTYTRTEPLPKQFVFSATGAISAPTSFESQKAGLITSPTLILQLDKKVGKYIGLSARALGAVFVTKYREMEGGAANQKWRLGGTLAAEATMPFHEPLSIGVDVGTAYSWYYEVQDGGGTVTPNGVTNDAQFPNNQPIQQSYTGEIFARYVLPDLGGVKSDIMVAFADGDPSLGSNSVLHEGVARYYLFFRQTADVYGAITIRY